MDDRTAITVRVVRAQDSRPIALRSESRREVGEKFWTVQNFSAIMLMDCLTMPQLIRRTIK